MKKKNKNRGHLIWITGLSGSGKTSLANAIKLRIQKKYGNLDQTKEMQMS